MARRQFGITTGIVQEFQFGMNRSDHSRFVGDVFCVATVAATATPCSPM